MQYKYIMNEQNALYHLLNNAVKLQNSGNVDHARAIYHTILDEYPTHPDTLLNLSLIEFQQGRPNKAIDLLNICISKNETYYRSKQLLADIHSITGNHQEASSLYNNGYSQELKLNNPQLSTLTTLKGLVLHIIKSLGDNKKINLTGIKNFSQALVNTGELLQLIKPLAIFIKDSLVLSNFNEKTATIIIVILSNLLGFKKESPKQLNDEIFKQYFLPILKEAGESRFFSLLLEIENLIYANYVKQTETEEHFQYCFNHWNKIMLTAGKQLSRSATSFAIEPKKENIAFFFHNTSPLAHTQVVLNLLRGMKLSSTSFFHIKIYFFSGSHQATIQQFKDLDVEVSTLENSNSDGNSSFSKRLINLKNKISEDKVNTLIWVSLPTMLTLAFAMRMAPIQVWWSMKYHNFKSPDIDVYLGLGAFEKYRHMYGNQWRIGHTVYSSQYTSPKKEDVTETKKEFREFNVILSSLARPEKINNEYYLSTISRILKENSNACYLWAGQTELQSVDDFFISQGVKDQCFFIGWVDTKLYADVIDIYLDSFPFPCATTIIDAMLCAKPVVMIKTNESMEIGIPMLIRPILESNSVTEYQRNDVKKIFNISNPNATDDELLLLAENSDEYEKFTNKLIKDINFRKKSGEAYQQFTHRYLQDLNLMANSYSQHFTEIIENHRLNGSTL